MPTKFVKFGCNVLNVTTEMSNAILTHSFLQSHCTKL